MVKKNRTQFRHRTPDEYFLCIRKSHLWLEGWTSAKAAFSRWSSHTPHPHQYLYHDRLQGMDRALHLSVSVLDKCPAYAPPYRGHPLSAQDYLKSNT